MRSKKLTVLSFLLSVYQKQSRYFDCDDDDDSDTFSNLSAVIDTEEFSARYDNGETLYYCEDEGFCNYGNYDETRQWVTIAGMNIWVAEVLLS